jgi:hypothetical protein
MATGNGSAHKICVVCGQGSNRTDWKNQAVRNGETFVGCDHHTKEEFLKALPAPTAPATAKSA